MTSKASGRRKYTPIGMRSLLGLSGFSSKPIDPAVGVELGDAEALRVRDLVEQRAGAVRPALERGGDVGQRPAAQDVVAEDAAERVVADEVAGQADGVGDARARRAGSGRSGRCPKAEPSASSSTTSPTLLPPTMTMTSRMPIPASVSIG